MFALRMISLHTGVVFASDLILSLWRAYFQLESLSECVSMSHTEGKDVPDGELTKEDKPEEESEKTSRFKSYDLLDIAALNRPSSLQTPVKPVYPYQYNLDSSSTEEEEETETQQKKDEKKLKTHADHQKQRAMRFR